MNGTLYVRSVMLHWRSVTAFVVLGAVPTGLLALQHEPEFHSHVQLMAEFVKVRRTPVARLSPAQPEVAAAPAVDPASAVLVGRSLGADERLIEARVRTYAQKATNVGVTVAVRDALRLPYSADEVGARIATSSPLHSTLIDIVVRDADRDRSAAVVAKVAAELIRIADGEPLPDGEEESLRLRLSIREAVSTPADPAATPWLRYALGWTLGWLALGTGLATLQVLLRRRRTTLLDWLEQGWHGQVARTRAFARVANERFWGPGWR